MNTEVLKSFIEQVWNNGNIEAIADYIAPTYTIIHDPGDPWEGETLDLEGFKTRVSVSRAPVPDQKFQIQEIYEQNNTVCITWLWSGTQQGEVAGFPPSGKMLKMSGVTVYHFEGGKITGHWQVADRLSIFQQLQAFSNESA